LYKRAHSTTPRDTRFSRFVRTTNRCARAPPPQAKPTRGGDTSLGARGIPFFHIYAATPGSENPNGA